MPDGVDRGCGDSDFKIEALRVASERMVEGADSVFAEGSDFKYASFRVGTFQSLGIA